MSNIEQSSFSILPMTASHLTPALHLGRESGWNQLREDWQRLLAYEPEGCFVAIVDGRLAGTVTTTRYGSQLAWIGMMLVHPEFRRRGIATALMCRSIEYLRSHQVRCIKLDATPVGENVYKKLGFKVEWPFHRWSRAGSAVTTRPDVPAPDVPAPDVPGFDVPENVRVPETAMEADRDGFGADRGVFLRRLASGSFVHAIRDGYGMLRPGFLASYLGPVSAKTSSAAESIIAELCQQTDRTVFWDIPGPHTVAIQIARSLGFEPVRDLTRMWRGDKCLRPNLQLQYALADPGTG